MNDATREYNVKWVTLESTDGERTLKQHAYIPHIRKKAYTMEEYPGNKALCSNGGSASDEDQFDDWHSMISEEIQPNPCLRCLKIYNEQNKTV